MSSPTIPDLTSATVANDTDLLLLRQPGNSGGVDKKVTVALIRNINVAGLAPLPSNATGSDLMLIARGGTNYQIRHDQISVPSGTQMWFYANGTIAGWSLVATGDNLLAVKGGTEYVTGGVEAGTWQQHGVDGGFPGGGLSIAQMPSHSHTVRGTGATAGSGSKVRGYMQDPFLDLKTWNTNSQGNGDPHNHGSTWRPKANVGVILRKN